jgi:hypothetical protein
MTRVVPTLAVRSATGAAITPRAVSEKTEEPSTTSTPARSVAAARLPTVASGTGSGPATSGPGVGHSSVPEGTGGGLLSAALGSFFGALGGAAVVLFVEWRRKRHEKIVIEIGSLRRCQFDLSRRLSALDVIEQQWLSPATKSHGGHWVALQPLPGMALPESMDLEGVGFLLAKHPAVLELVYRADIAFQSYRSLVIEYLAERKLATVAIERSLGGPISGSISIPDVERHAGQRTDALLKSLVQLLYRRLPEVRAILDQAFGALGERMRGDYAEAPLRLSPSSSNAG